MLARIERALREFGSPLSALTSELFLVPDNLIRMGVPPIRIEILTSVSGVEFETCYAEKIMIRIDEMEIPVISLARLRQNKARQREDQRSVRIWKICRIESCHFSLTAFSLRIHILLLAGLHSGRMLRTQPHSDGFIFFESYLQADWLRSFEPASLARIGFVFSSNFSSPPSLFRSTLAPCPTLSLQWSCSSSSQASA